MYVDYTNLRVNDVVRIGKTNLLVRIMKITSVDDTRVVFDASNKKAYEAFGPNVEVIFRRVK